MKIFVRSLFAVLCLLTLCLTLSLCIGAEPSSVEFAVLNGNASLDAPADLIVIRFEAASYSRTQERACRDNDALLEKLKQALAAYGELSEDGFYTCEGFSGTRFCVTRCLSLVTSQVEKAEEIRKLLHDCGVSSLQEISGVCSDPSSYEAEALRLAIADAVAKASALGITAQAIEVEEMGCFCYGSSPLGEGQVPQVHVECCVRVRFGSCGKPSRPLD